MRATMTRRPWLPRKPQGWKVMCPGRRKAAQSACGAPVWNDQILVGSRCAADPRQEQRAGETESERIGLQYAAGVGDHWSQRAQRSLGVTPRKGARSPPDGFTAAKGRFIASKWPNPAHSPSDAVFLASLNKSKNLCTFIKCAFQGIGFSHSLGVWERENEATLLVKLLYFTNFL